MRYYIYILFRNGEEGYFYKVEDGVVRYFSEYVSGCCYHAPNYERALAKAKWLCKTFRCVGRTEIVKKDSRYF